MLLADMHGWGGWMGAGGMMLFWLIVVAVAVWAIYRLTRSPSPSQQQVAASATSAQSPIEILERRLADGEITVEEYSDRRARLEHDAANRALRH